MPFLRPTLGELTARAESDFETRLPGADPKLRRSVMAVLSRVHSGATNGLYGYISWVAEQVIIDTAAVEYLDRWAAVWGIGRKAASYANGPVTFTGTDGASIPEGTLLQLPDGTIYRTDALATIAAGSASTTVTAVAPGEAGNAAAGVQVGLVSPVPDVVSAALVGLGGLTGGADTESDESLRERLLQRIRQPPHGGATFDYVTWAREIPGVTRVWVYPLALGLGTVTVRFMMDGTYPDGIPQAADVAAVQDHIDRRRPVTAHVTVVAPVAAPLHFTIANLNPDSAAVRIAIAAELQDLISRTAEPGGTILISQIREAISIAAGEVDHVLIAPTANVIHASGRIATFGGITWA